MPFRTPNSISTCKRFFLEPSSPKQRQYEALRAYFAEELPLSKGRPRFWWNGSTLRMLA